MSLWSIWLVGFGVSADAFAASLTSGVKMGRFNYRHALIIALTFAGFQAAMPLLGWLMAANFTGFLDPFDHWIAFALLAIIGGKMTWEALQADEDDGDSGQGSRLDLRRLLILGIATSIDAAARAYAAAIRPERTDGGADAIRPSTISRRPAPHCPRHSSHRGFPLPR